MDKKQITPQRKELPWYDDPRLGHYIDDDALFVLDSITRGHLSGKNASNFFFIASWHPIDWDIKMLVKFLIRVAEEYSLKLKNFSTMTYAFAEEYEKNLIDPKTNKPLPEYEAAYKEYFEGLEKFEKYKKERGFTEDDLFPRIGKSILVPPSEPRDYEGAYKWALDEIKRKPQSTEGKLFSKIFADKFNLVDLKEIIGITEKIVAINEPEDSIRFMRKKICNDIINWTSFEIEPERQTLGILRKDLNAYLEKFIKNELAMPPRDKRIGEVFILQNQNIYTFSKHKKLIFERLQEMHENCGNIFVFENPFEQILPEDRDNNESLKQRYANRQFLFKHAIFAFEKVGYIKILSLGNNWHYSEEMDALRDRAKIQLLPPIFKELGTEPKQTNLYFDDAKSCLFIRGTEIKIKKFSDQYHALRIMFENPDELAEEWFFSKMAEKYDLAQPPQDKKFYNAIYQISQKLKAKGIDDFFTTTRQSVKINEKYLS